MHSHALLAAISLMGFLIATSGQVLAEQPVVDTHSRFFVTVSEYQSEIAPAPNASAGSIMQMLMAENTKPVRTLRVSTIDECATQLSTSERVAITSPQTPGSSTTTTKPMYLEVGTMLDLRPKRVASGVLVELSYNVDQLQKNNGPVPSIKAKTVQTTDLFEIGEPKLVGGLTGDGYFYLVVTVTEPIPTAQKSK